ncbi:helix-turn-helix domain-containing protein [Streptomyces sp. NPDC058595]|uniref:helix-turn-helix domain-containing protein n=1 Tax=Streptomyces sp. NPDC058595 TaxID=3346550 RepID=UPI00364E07E3
MRLSREQVHRLAAQVPPRLSMDVLAALCSILDGTPADLITVTETTSRSPGRPRRERPPPQRRPRRYAAYA